MHASMYIGIYEYKAHGSATEISTKIPTNNKHNSLLHSHSIFLFLFFY